MLLGDLATSVEEHGDMSIELKTLACDPQHTTSVLHEIHRHAVRTEGYGNFLIFFVNLFFQKLPLVINFFACI